MEKEMSKSERHELKKARKLFDEWVKRHKNNRKEKLMERAFNSFQQNLANFKARGEPLDRLMESPWSDMTTEDFIEKYIGPPGFVLEEEDEDFEGGVLYHAPLVNNKHVKPTLLTNCDDVVAEEKHRKEVKKAG